MEQKDFLELKNIHKSFSGNKVLSNISLTFRKGEIHSIVGENGAGKSTLMKIIAGIYRADSGEILKQGEKIAIKNPNDAHKQGIGIIHQELSVFDNMTIAHNVFVNREPTGWLGFIDWKKMRKEANTEFEKIGLRLNPDEKIEDHSVGIQQMVEIVKTLSLDAELLIMDEPTSALSIQETKILFELLFKLREEGRSIVFISHKLSEVLYLSDRISVLRDGCLMGTMAKGEADVAKIITMMVGRTIEQLYPPKAQDRAGRDVLEVIGLAKNKKFSDISFSLKQGEILGLFGLIGSGRTELAYAIVGADTTDSGKVLLDQQEVKFRSPRQAIKAGVCYLTEDRRSLGLFLNMSVEENMVSSSIDSISGPFGFLRPSASHKLGVTFLRMLDVIPKDPEKRVEFLSGGNQQKVLLGKWLATEPKVLIVDEPTRGVDVGAKVKIHKILRDLANQGMAILLISSDLPEILGVSDRIMIMHEGIQKGILENDDRVTEKVVMTRAFAERSQV